MAHVILYIKIRVFDPVGAAEIAWHESELAPENGREMLPALQHREDLFEPDLAVRGCRLVVDTHSTDVLGEAVYF